MVNETDIRKLTNLAIRKAKQGRPKEKALVALAAAGIIMENGNYTKPYRHIGRLVKKGGGHIRRIYLRVTSGIAANRI